MADERPPNLPQQPQLIINQNINLVYANGITLNVTQSDVQIAFSLNGRPVIATAMSLPVAKHLKNSLEKALNNYEAKTGIAIGDLVDLTEKLKNK